MQNFVLMNFTSNNRKGQAIYVLECYADKQYFWH